MAAVTIGHLLMALGAALAFAAAARFVSGFKYSGPDHGRGTPGYARARTGRRSALYLALLGAILFVAGCFTPLADMRIAA